MGDRMNDPTKNPSSSLFNPTSRDEAISIGKEVGWRYPALNIIKPAGTDPAIWDAFKGDQKN